MNARPARRRIEIGPGDDDARIEGVDEPGQTLHIPVLLWGKGFVSELSVTVASVATAAVAPSRGVS